MSKVKVLFYCTKPKDRFRIGHFYHHNDELYKLPNGTIKFGSSVELMSYESCEYNKDNFLNGKIVAECEIDKIEEIRMLQDNNMTYKTKTLTEEQLLIKSCLEGYQLGNYLGLLYENKCGYALHLTKLKVFDKPKDLSDYMKKNQSYRLHKYERLYNALQNMMTIYDNEENEYILISIRSEWLYKIINGEKTIVVKKKILNCMKGLIAND